MSVNICFNWTELDFWVFLDDKVGWLFAICLMSYNVDFKTFQVGRQDVNLCVLYV